MRGAHATDVTTNANTTALDHPPAKFTDSRSQSRGRYNRSSRSSSRGRDGRGEGRGGPRGRDRSYGSDRGRDRRSTSR
eukprot:2313178-Pyramimonas_sp.AAC.1